MNGIVAVAAGADRSSRHGDRCLARLGHLGHAGPARVERHGIYLGAQNFQPPAAAPDVPRQPIVRGHRPDHAIAVDGVVFRDRDHWNALRRCPGIHLADCPDRWPAAFVACRGRFAVVAADFQSRSLHLYRSMPFGRPLFYWYSGDLLVAASEPRAVIAHPSVPVDVNHQWVAAFLALRWWDKGETAFAGVRELYPGEHLLWQAGRITLQRSVRLAHPAVDRRCDEREHAERFRKLLDRAVVRLLPESGDAGIMLSGGLDSAAAGVLGGRRLAERSHRLHVCSWSLPTLPECDESAAIARLAARWRSPVHWLKVREPSSLLFVDDCADRANSPLVNPMQRLFEAIYRHAARQRLAVLLNGAAGDGLYRRHADRLSDALRHRRLTTLTAEIAHLVRRGRLLHDPAVRRLARTPASMRRRPVIRAPTWLTAAAAATIRVPDWPPEAGDDDAGRHLRAAFGVAAVVSSGWADTVPESHGVQRLDPYLDADMVRFGLALPGYLCLRRGRTKVVARQAMAGYLPDEIRNVPRQGRLDALLHLGFRQARPRIVTALGQGTAWSRYVDRRCLLTAVGVDRPSDDALLVAWRCVALERWLRSWGL